MGAQAQGGQETGMMNEGRDALSGASLLSAARAGQETCGRCAGGAARASRTKSEISCIQGMRVCFDLDPSSLSLRRVKVHALRGNTPTFPSCRGSFGRKTSLRPNDPRLEARWLIPAAVDRPGVRFRCARSSEHHRMYRVFVPYSPSRPSTREMPLAMSSMKNAGKPVWRRSDLPATES